MKPIVRASVLSDAMLLSPRLRKADVQELEALGVGTYEALRAGLEYPEFCYTVEAGGQPVAMFGVTPMQADDTVGVPWLLAADEFLTLFSFKFLRQCRTYVRRMNEAFPILCNWTDSRNEASLRWLYWCGFKFLNVVPPPNYPSGLFVSFVRYRTPCVTR